MVVVKKTLRYTSGFYATIYTNRNLLMKSGMNGKSVDSNFIFQYIFLVILYLFFLLKYF